MSTLPIYWGEAAAFGDLLSKDTKPGWVRNALEGRFRLTPIDTLEEQAIVPFDTLLLAQPRALSGPENVALDAWVRKGGRLLVFADPMLTAHSSFAIGDRRRPQDVILLSPILSHWGLTLTFDEDQAEGERTGKVGELAIPLNLPGAFTASPDQGCKIIGTVLAQCRIGEGRVTVLADAAILEDPEGEAGTARQEALGHLVSMAFD